MHISRGPALDTTGAQTLVPYNTGCLAATPPGQTRYVAAGQQINVTFPTLPAYMPGPWNVFQAIYDHKGNAYCTQPHGFNNRSDHQWVIWTVTNFTFNDGPPPAPQEGKVLLSPGDSATFTVTQVYDSTGDPPPSFVPIWMSGNYSITTIDKVSSAESLRTRTSGRLTMVFLVLWTMLVLAMLH